MVTSNNEKILGVQAARGVAALLVVLFHGQTVIGLPEYGGIFPFYGLFAFGHSGVDFFFVLSGFIIFQVHSSDLGRPNKLAEFFWKRVTRIYPLFLLVMSFYTVKIVINGTFNWVFFIKSIFLLPQPTHPILMQAWTLTHEMLFYAVFGIAIISQKFARVIIVLWLAGSIYVGCFEPKFASGFVADFLAVATSPYNVLFLFGISVAWLANRVKTPCPRMVALVGVGFFIMTGIAENRHLIPKGAVIVIFSFGLSAGLMLLGLVSAEVSGRIHVGKFGAVLGDISYPLYMTHGAVISIVMSVSKAMNFRGQGWIILLAITLAASIVALGVNRVFERPVATVLRNLYKKR